MNNSKNGSGIHAEKELNKDWEYWKNLLGSLRDNSNFILTDTGKEGSSKSKDSTHNPFVLIREEEGNFGNASSLRAEDELSEDSKKCAMRAKVAVAAVTVGLGIFYRNPIRQYVAKTALPAIMHLAAKKVFVGKVLGLCVAIAGWHIALAAVVVLAVGVCVYQCYKNRNDRQRLNSETSISYDDDDLDPEPHEPVPL